MAFAAGGILPIATTVLLATCGSMAVSNGTNTSLVRSTEGIQPWQHGHCPAFPATRSTGRGTLL
eukprot:1745339-Lingulodinium_polyedra.AAC.1